MSLYHILFACLLLGVFIELSHKETPKVYFNICFSVLTLMLCLRFGQGADYYSYNSIFTTMPLTLPELLTYRFGKVEIGWRFLCAAFKLLGCSFPFMIFVLAILEMLLFLRFINRYCKYKLFALFLGYHTFYLTYLFGALRQALVIALFLGLLLEWLLQGKYLRYCVAVCVCVCTVA